MKRINALRAIKRINVLFIYFILPHSGFIARRAFIVRSTLIINY
jgi:hypothetical protein